MNKSELLLTAMYPAGIQSHTPVQVQKLLFLIQRKIPNFEKLGFNFEPYDYGPFDKSLYTELEHLKEEGLININVQPNSKWSSYNLTKEGINKGKEQFNNLDPSVKEIIEKLSKFVRKLSFSELVSAVYKAYPEMKQNSVFKE